MDLLVTGGVQSALGRREIEQKGTQRNTGKVKPLKKKKRKEKRGGRGRKSNRALYVMTGGYSTEPHFALQPKTGSRGVLVLID